MSENGMDSKLLKPVRVAQHVGWGVKSKHLDGEGSGLEVW